MVVDRQTKLEEELRIKNDALESALQRETVIRQIIQTVHSSLNLEETFQQLATSLGVFLKADRCFISRYDDRQSILYPPTLEFRSSEAIESMINSNSELWIALCKFAHQL